MEQTDIFPDKPVFENRNSSLLKSIISVALFIITFYIFFNKDVNFILVLVLVLFIHELGHFIAMKYYNYTEVKMFFIPLLGALVIGQKKEISQRQRTTIILAGPIPGIMIGIILYAIGAENDIPNFKMAANIFVFLNVFNLLPITPLDGGNLIETLFFNEKIRVQTIFIIISVVALVVISLYLKSYFLLIVPFFLLTRIQHQYKIKIIKKELDNSGIIYNKPYEELTNKEYWQIREAIIKNLPSFKNVQTKDFSVSKYERQIVIQIKSLAIKGHTVDLSRTRKTLIVVIWFLFLIGPIFAIALINKSKRSIYTINDRKEQMIQDCIMSTGDIAKKYPTETREYCVCAMDTIFKRFSETERLEHDKLSHDQRMQLYIPYIQNCINEFQLNVKKGESQK